MNAPSVIRHGLILVGGHPGKVKLEGKKRMVIHFDPASERLKIAYDTHPVL